MVFLRSEAFLGYPQGAVLEDRLLGGCLGELGIRGWLYHH